MEFTVFLHGDRAVFLFEMGGEAHPACCAFRACGVDFQGSEVGGCAKVLEILKPSTTIRFVMRALGVSRVHDMIECLSRVAGVPGAHQGLRRRGGRASENGTAALLELTSAAAGAFLVGGRFQDSLFTTRPSKCGRSSVVVFEAWLSP